MSNRADRLTRVKACRHGTMVYLRTDRFIGASLDLYGEYCEAEAALFAQIVKPGDTVVEVGANIGAHTVPLARLVGARGRVLAFEPQPLIFQLLCANVALNEAFRVRAYNAACGSAPGRLAVPSVAYEAEGSNFGGVGLVPEGQGEAVDVVPLDALPLPSLRLLKVDVEGMEAAVVAGARAHIARCRPAIYVENDRRASSPGLISLIQGMGYDLWWHTAYLFNPNNHAGAAENIFANIASLNMLCLPAEQHNTVTGFRRIAGPDDWWED